MTQVPLARQSWVAVVQQTGAVPPAQQTVPVAKQMVVLPTVQAVLTQTPR